MKTNINVARVLASTAMGLALIVLALVPIALPASNAGASTRTSSSVRTGVSTHGIDTAHDTSGVITGTVTDAADPGGSAGVCVDAFDGTDTDTGDTTTAVDGTYTITGLVPGPFQVYFDPTCTGSESSPEIPQWYLGATTQSGATTISVASATTTSGIDASLQLSTSIAVSSNANPQFVATSVTYSATISPTDNGGTVAFSDNSVPISACASQPVTASVASCTQSYVGSGLNVISAAYSGDTGYAPSNSANYDEVIQSVPGGGGTTTATKTTTVVTSSANPVITGSNITYSAAVSPTDGNGTVSFFDGSEPLLGCQGVALNAGVATCTQFDPPPGIHTITASFSGTSAFGPSTSADLSEVDMYKVVMTINSSFNPAGDPATVIFTAATYPNAVGGTIRFEDNGATIVGCAHQTLTKGQSTCRVKILRPGRYAISAVYSGDAAYAGATSSALSEKVLRRSAVTVNTSNYTIKKGRTIHFVARVDAKYGSGFVTFTNNGRTIPGCGKVKLRFGISHCSVRNFSVGHHIVSVAFSGNSRFGPSYQGLLQIVTK